MLKTRSIKIKKAGNGLEKIGNGIMKFAGITL
jgi:hypothetical protein